MATPFKRKACIGLKFSESVDIDIICATLFGRLEIKYDDIVGFQECKFNKVEVKFKDADTHKQFVLEYAGKDIVLDNENDHITVNIQNMSDIYTWVSIRYAPYDLPNETVARIE